MSLQATATSDTPILGADEAASRLRCSESAIADWVDRGLLPAQPDRHGRRVVAYATVSRVLEDLRIDRGEGAWSEPDVERALETLRADDRAERPGPPPPPSWGDRLAAWFEAVLRVIYPW